jgi:glycosyltransferase involved in cell wall biosynthesis
VKVLFLVHQFFPEFSAGTEVLTRDTAWELQNRGYEVGILTMRHTGFPRDQATDGADYEEIDGIPVWKLDYNFYIAPDPLTNEFNNPKMAQFLDRFLDEFRPDLIHIMHCFRFSASVIETFVKKRIPAVLTVTDFWFICPRIQLKDAYGNDCCGPRCNSANCVRCLARSNGVRQADLLERIPLFLLALAGHLIKYFKLSSDRFKAVQFVTRRPKYLMRRLNKLGRVIVPTETMKQMLIENGANGKNIVKLHFGLSNEQTKAVHEIKKRTGFLTIGYIGSLLEHKGAHVLLEAFTELPDSNVSLQLYGDPNTNPAYMENLKRIAGLDNRISFMGTFPNSAIGNVLDGIDVLVVPSIWYENTPLVVFSAFAAKTPVVATDLGGLTEVVKDGENGLVFPKGDVQSLRRVLRRLLDEPELLSTLSAGIGPVKSMRQSADELETIYADLTAGN